MTREELTNKLSAITDTMEFDMEDMSRDEEDKEMRAALSTLYAIVFALDSGKVRECAQHMAEFTLEESRQALAESNEISPAQLN